MTSDGRYRLLRCLRRDPRGERWLARQIGLAGFEKLVVVRRSPPGADDDAMAGFLEEARIIASLHHPHVVQVQDVGSDGAGYYYVTEHLEGLDVGRLLRAIERRLMPLSDEHAVQIVLGAAAGLHAARRLIGRGRGVAASDLVVTFDGAVKLVEAPRGGTIDSDADVLALGELLRRLASAGRRAMDVRGGRGAREGRYPAPIERIVARAMGLPDERFASAADLFAALERAAAALGLALSPWALGRAIRGLAGDAGDGEPALTDADGDDAFDDDRATDVGVDPSGFADGPRDPATEVGAELSALADDLGDLATDVGAEPSGFAGERGDLGDESTAVQPDPVGYAASATLEAERRGGLIDPLLRIDRPRPSARRGPPLRAPLAPPRETALGTGRMPRLVPRPEAAARLARDLRRKPS